MSRYLVAAVQMTSTDDKKDNLATAERLIKQAADRGAQLVVLPELFNCLGSPEAIVSGSETIPGPTSELMSGLAAECRITLVAGSIAERQDDEKVCNSSIIFGPDGSQLNKYQKLHLFDIDLPGAVTFRESDFMTPGQTIAMTQSEPGMIGQATCYDLRFPELFRQHVLHGANLVVVPSAFTMATGRDHWEILVRARAIENQLFMVAPNQFGKHDDKLQTYGRSMIVDPWGTVLAQAADGQNVIVAEIDLDQQSAIRNRLPCLEHRRNLDQLKCSANVTARP